MTTFAKIENGVVVSIIVASQNWIDAQDEVYVITPIGTTPRKTVAAIGSTYDSNRGAFINPKPFPSWVFNENNYQWEAPIKNTNKAPAIWNESDQAWDLIKNV